MKPHANLLDRFWSHVDTSGGEDACWPFKARFTNVGYCHIWLRGDVRIPGDRCEMLVHRFSWELHNGQEIPPRLKVDHLCKLRHCVNPRHLRVTTQRINSTENSVSPHARNAQKTVCKHGHPFAGENLARILTRHYRGYWQGTRVCLTCQPSARNHPRRFWYPGDLDSLNNQGGGQC